MRWHIRTPSETGRWLIGLLALACLAGAGCREGEPECAIDDECEWPERCIEGYCIDDSCPVGCPIGEYCSAGTCWPCTAAEHCGDNCIDCTAMGNDMACIMLAGPYGVRRCGCYSDWDCLQGFCCHLYNCGVCR